MSSATLCGDTMQDNRKFLEWCFKQEKGIKMVSPSENLQRAYLEKSRNALKSMEVNAEAGITEWAVSASYYAKYFAVYALLAKTGVKCEIHDCTIALFNQLFGDTVPHGIVTELRRSKEDRIELQYYTREVKVNLGQLIAQTKNFVLEIERLMDSLNSEKIKAVQAKLKQLMK